MSYDDPKNIKRNRIDVRVSDYQHDDLLKTAGDKQLIPEFLRQSGKLVIRLKPYFQNAPVEVIEEKILELIANDEINRIDREIPDYQDSKSKAS